MRFRREVVRNADGDVATATAPELVARSEEGPGVVVVTLVVVTHRKPITVEHPRDADSIRAALADRGKLTASQLVALEVVWSPAAEDDRMSTAELEKLYPELASIPPASPAAPPAPTAKACSRWSS